MGKRENSGLLEKTGTKPHPSFPCTPMRTVNKAGGNSALVLDAFLGIALLVW